MKLYHCLFITAIVSAGTASGTASAGHTDPLVRGMLLRSVPLGHLEPDEIIARLQSEGADTSAVRLPIDLYRLEYRTIDAQQQPTIASGLVAVPDDHARTSIVISFTHGTEPSRSGGPSRALEIDNNFGIVPALAYASAGFVVSEPDYLGLGTGLGLHPYMDVPSETTATLDMLRAARQFTEQQQRRLARRALVTGFSQGAFAALGLARELGRGGDAWFRVGAVAPISGPYHGSQWVHDAIAAGGGVDSEVTTVDPKGATMYLAYLSVAWNRLHRLYATPSAWYQAPYADSIDAFMDGSHEVPEILQFLPGRPSDLFTRDAIAAFRHPSGRLAAAFDVLDRTCEFTATAPVRLFAASGDLDVAIDFSRQCRGQLAARGSRVELIDVGDVGHLGSNIASTAQVLSWFSALRDRRDGAADD
jgi:hypothetical protein